MTNEEIMKNLNSAVYAIIDRYKEKHPGKDKEALEYGRKALEKLIENGSTDAFSIDDEANEKVEQLNRIREQFLGAISSVYVELIDNKFVFDEKKEILPLNKPLQFALMGIGKRITEPEADIVTKLIKGEFVKDFSNDPRIQNKANARYTGVKQYVITVVSKRIIDEFVKNLSSNVLVFRKNLDRVRDLIFTGVNAKAGEYGNIGTTLFAASIEGERRALQEDTVMLLVHPKIPDFKLLLVADGLSENGADKPKIGHVASHMAAQMTRDWFENLDNPELYYNNPSSLKPIWEKQIHEISEEIEGDLDRMQIDKRWYHLFSYYSW